MMRLAREEVKSLVNSAIARKPSFPHFQYPYPPEELGGEVIAAAATLAGEALELTDADDAVVEGASVAAVKRMIDCEVLEAAEDVEEDEEVVLAEDDTDDVEELEAEEVEGLPPPKRLDRRLVASSGVRVVVKVASVMVAEGKRVMVTADDPVVPEGNWDAVEVGTEQPAPVERDDVPEMGVGSLLLLHVVAFVSVPKMPPVAPVAAITDAALASLVQVNNTPSALTDGMAKQFCEFAQRPLDVSQVPLTQVAMEFSTQAASPALQGSVAVRFWNMLLSLWASWPFCKRAAASSAAGAERTSVVTKLAKTKEIKYCIFLPVKKRARRLLVK
jgi:hypothetical protein